MTRILCYHDVAPTAERELTGFAGPTSARYKLTPAQFERHLDAVAASDKHAGLLGQRPDVALTFDDGGTSALRVAAVLERRGFRGHFFVVTSMLGAPGFLSEDQVRELSARGHEVGSHSHTHPPYIERLAPTTLAYEWRSSREHLTQVLGRAPRLAAVPGGRMSKVLLEQVAAAGFEILLTCEPTTRVRRHGELAVLGRYTLWANTSPARAGAYTRGRPGSIGWLNVQWRIKQVARHLSPEVYERLRGLNAGARPLRSGSDEARDGGSLALLGEPSNASQARSNEPLPQLRVVDQGAYGRRSRGGVVGRHQQGAVPQRPHAPHSGGDRRQPACVGLDQHLGQALGVRDVQKSVALAVQVEEAAVKGNVPAQLAGVPEAQLRDARLEQAGHVPLSADNETPTGIALSQQRDHVRQEQRVLLGVDPSHGQEDERIAVIGAAGGALPGLDVASGDQRDGRCEDGGRAPVAGGEVGSDGDNRVTQREHPPAALERPGDDLQRSVSRVSVANVGGKVLAHTEDQPTAPDARDQGKDDRVRVRAQREDGVGAVKRAPHSGTGAGNGSENRYELAEARVVRQCHEFDGAVELVMRRTGPVVEAPEQTETSEFASQRAYEADKGPFGEDSPAALAVQVIGVDDQAHGGLSHAATMTPNVSVLIPVLDEETVLERTVPTMLAQRDAGEIEFIFAEGGSVDGSRDVLERFAARDPRVQVIENASGHTPDGLNAALAHARGEFVARMDAHCFYPETYLAEGIARLKRGDVAWVAGPAMPGAYGGFSGTVALALRSPLGRGPSRRLAAPGDIGEVEADLDTGVFAGVWRRSVLERYGGWEPGWLRNQDSELAARFLAAGERIVSLPSMTAEYVPRRTLPAFVRQYHDYGRYRVRTLARHHVARRRSHVLAPALAATLPAAASSSRALRAPARAALVAYVTAVSFETLRAAPRAPVRDVRRLPAAFAAMHLAFGFGMWRGLAEAGLEHAKSAAPRGMPNTRRAFRPRSGK